MTDLDPRTTALVLIDLQKGIVDMPFEPRSGAQILQTSIGLAQRFRAAGAPVVLVNVAWSADFGDALRQPVDQPTPRPTNGLPAGWSDLADGLPEPTDIRVTKRQWGAFYGTDLELQLRRRGVKTIVLGGVATNFGVESTARQAWEHGYNLVIAEDATASRSSAMHDFAITAILPRIAILAQSADIAFAKS
ncbi:MAG: hydrolase [Methylocella sp.]